MAVKPDWRAGLPSGARYWIYFMIGFFLLGYSWLLSIAYGAIAGFAIGIIAAWWNAKEDDAPAKPVEKQQVAEPDTPTRRVHFRKTRGLGRLRPIRPSRSFGWLFRRK